jgi:hypothetical protein
MVCTMVVGVANVVEPVSGVRLTDGPKRRHRTYPRVVKRARHNSYRVKRATDTGTKHDGPPTIHLRQVA